MEWWQAIVLGLVEGLTEYLPISSTGHLILAQRAMGIAGSESANAFAICIQGGAIVAVLGLYAGRVRQMAAGTLGAAGLTARRDEAGLRMAVNLAAAFVPAAVIGLLLNEWIEERLFGPWPIVAALFVGGLAILAVARWRKRRAGGEGAPGAGVPGAGAKVGGTELEAMTWRMAVVIGLIQCVAMWPGTSRSLVTIVGGVLVGLSLAAAVEFSFLLGVVTLLAAMVYKALIDEVVVEVDGEVRETVMLVWMVEEYGVWPLLLGSLAAWASAVAAVKWMVAYLRKHGLELFGYYRVGLAVVVAALLLTGALGDEPAAEPEGVPVPRSEPAPVPGD